LSLEGFQLSVNDDSVTLEAARLVGADGGLVSGQAVVDTIRVTLLEWFPAASYASSASV
jgi:hypothetical protein